MTDKTPPEYSQALKVRSDPVFFVYAKGIVKDAPASSVPRQTGKAGGASVYAANEFTAGDLDLSSRVTSIEYEDDEKKTDLLKLSIDNSDLYFLSEGYDQLKKGVELVASWCYAAEMSPVRRCVVQKIKGSTTLTVEAQDNGVLMQKQTRSRTFENMTRSAIVAQIATENGYGEDAQQIVETKEVFPHVVQASQTDAQFVKKLADIEGFEFFVDFDGFHWHPRHVGQTPMRRFQYYLPPNVADIESFEFEADVAGKPGSVTAVGKDPATKKDVSATADQSNVTRDTTAPTPDVKPLPPAPPPDVKIDRATGTEVTVYPAPPKNSGAADPNASGITKPTTATTQTAASNEASGAFIRTQQATGTLTLNLVGDPGVLAKSVIQVDGIGTAISGRYYVANAKHTITPSGYKLVLKCKTDGHNGSAAGATPNKATPNTKDGPDPSSSSAALPAALPPSVKVDRASGVEVTQYQTTGGREPAPKS